MSLRGPKHTTPEAIQELAEHNLSQAVRIKCLEGMIRGLMDAMKPFLDEWQKLTSGASNDR